MLLKEPVVNGIVIFLISKTVILSAVLAYNSFYGRRNRQSKGKAAANLKHSAAPRLVLTLKDKGTKKSGAGKDARTALQHTIEETFSSN